MKNHEAAMPPVAPSMLQRTGAIQTRADLEALMRSREELTSQLERVTQQRGELAQQRLNAEARAQSSANPALDRRLMQDYEQQIAQLGDRSAQLQRAIAQADEAVANAIARGVGGELQGGQGGPAVTSTVISVPGEDFSAREAALHDRYTNWMIIEGLSIVLACVVIGRMLWRRALRRTAASFASAGDVTNMRVAIDAIALEVERISENQRYATKLLQERADVMPRFESSAAPVGAEVRRGETPAR